MASNRPTALFEINAHVWLREQAWVNPERPDLADIPDSQIRDWAGMGFDMIWFLGVWTKGAATKHICLSNNDLRDEFEKALPGFQPEHVLGSPFSVAEYNISPLLGNETTLPRLREKLNAQGIRLMLDFVPNHFAVDHRWTVDHPDWFVNGTTVDLERRPGDYFRVPDNTGLILAHGRDPFFAGWTDTVQVNIMNPRTRRALTDEMLKVSGQCDALRCDMAMLITNDVFRRTWGDLSVMFFPDGDVPEFWPGAIAEVKAQHPDFLFCAEVYWGLERRLQGMGFDFTYDKAFYDFARSGDGATIRRHLVENRDVETRMIKFLENHDENRAAAVLGDRHRAMAVLLATLPGLRLYQEGQFENMRVRLPVQLGARPQEPVDRAMLDFYSEIFSIGLEPVLRHGEYSPLYVSEAWEANHTASQLVTAWRTHQGEHLLAAVNIGHIQAQGYTEIPAYALGPDVIEFQDMLSDIVYYRSTARLRHYGLYLDMPPGGYHLFKVRPAPAGRTADH